MSSQSISPARRIFPHCLVLAVATSTGVAPSNGQPADPVSQDIMIFAGAVLTDPGKPPLGPQTIVVRNHRIVLLEPGFRQLDPKAPRPRLINMSDKFLMPGLIDMHMHLAISMNADSATVASPPKLALYAAGYARKLLEAGVTTVRDAGDNTGTVFALRDAVQNGDVIGPRIFAAGRIISRTGGHGAKHPEIGDIPYIPATCDGTESCRKVVRENVEQGSDWIKITVSGSGRETTGRAAAAPTMFPDEIAAVVAAARQASRPVAAHAHSTAAINLALSLGVKTIEHGTYFDATSVKLFKQHHAYLIPTAFVADFVRSKAELFAHGTDGMEGAELIAWANAAMAGPGRAWRAGIPLGLGTDAGPSFEPSATAHEIELYVASGVPPAEAIRAATATNAAILSMSGQLGRIAPGYLADLIAVDGNPVQDVSRLHDIVFVMKDGEVVRIDAPPLRSPNAQTQHEDDKK